MKLHIFHITFYVNMLYSADTRFHRFKKKTVFVRCRFQNQNCCFHKKKNPNIFILLLKLQYKDTTHCTCTQKRDSQRWSTKPCLNKLCVWDNVQMFYVLYIKDNNFMIDCMCTYKRNDMIKQVKNMVDRCRFIYTNWSSFSICILWPRNQTRRHQSKEKVFFRSTPAFLFLTSTAWSL